MEYYGNNCFLLFSSDPVKNNRRDMQFSSNTFPEHVKIFKTFRTTLSCLQPFEMF